MRVSDVRKIYPEFFVTIEAAVWDDCQNVRYKGRPSMIRPMIARRIAYNAAAIATLELHKQKKTIKDLKKILAPWSATLGIKIPYSSIIWLANKIK